MLTHLVWAWFICSYLFCYVLIVDTNVAVNNTKEILIFFGRVHIRKEPGVKLKSSQCLKQCLALWIFRFIMFRFIDCSHYIHIFKPLSINKEWRSMTREVILEITEKKAKTSSHSLSKFSNIFSTWIALWSLSTVSCIWSINLVIRMLVTTWTTWFLYFLTP